MGTVEPRCVRNSNVQLWRRGGAIERAGSSGVAIAGVSLDSVPGKDGEDAVGIDLEYLPVVRIGAINRLPARSKVTPAIHPGGALRAGFIVEGG